MSLIFDGFPGYASADAFGFACYQRFGRTYDLYRDADVAADCALFPYVLTAPVVLVERRSDDAEEAEIEAFVEEFGGRFAGT